MALPEEFSPWEHLQSVVIQSHNRMVREQFNDLGEDWDDDITTPRGSLRVACTLRDDDSAVMTQIRMSLFYMTLRGASDLHPPLYTMPTDRYQQEVKFAPQVTLYFREDKEDVEETFKPIDAEISFRLIHETYNTFTPSNAHTLATLIRNEFASGEGYRWRKGRTKLSYRDKDHGYQFSCNAFSEAEGRELISKVLQLQEHTIDSSALSITQLAEAPPILPPTQEIYGKARRLPRRRPVGWVRFRYAEVHVWGVDKAITLVDLTGRRWNALISA